MNSKPTMRKALKKAQYSGVRGSHIAKSYVEVGSWRFQEDEAGDLVIIHMETNQTVTLIKKSQ